MVTVYGGRHPLARSPAIAAATCGTNNTRNCQIFSRKNIDLAFFLGSCFQGFGTRRLAGISLVRLTDKPASETGFSKRTTRVLLYRHVLLQLFQPIQGDVDLLGRSFAGIGGSRQQHDKVFAIGSDIKAITGSVRHDSFDW